MIKSNLGLEIPPVLENKAAGIEQEIGGVKYTVLVHTAESAKESVNEKFKRILADAVMTVI